MNAAALCLHSDCCFHTHKETLASILGSLGSCVECWNMDDERYTGGNITLNHQSMYLLRFIIDFDMLVVKQCSNVQIRSYSGECREKSYFRQFLNTKSLYRGTHIEFIQGGFYDSLLIDYFLRGPTSYSNNTVYNIFI